MKTKSEISALIHLLDDPDEEIYNHIKNKLLGYGYDALMELEAYDIHEIYSDLLQSRVEEVKSLLKFNATKSQMLAWKKDPESTLLDAMLILSRFKHLDFDEDELVKTIDQLKHEVWIEFGARLTAYEKISLINQVLFTIEGFAGDTEDYHSPLNSYLHTVLERKKGNAISLSIIYLILTEHLELPVYGVNMPRHFILGYRDEFFGDDSSSETQALFYINPFSGGQIISREELNIFLSSIQIEPKASYFVPASKEVIIERVINNLIYAHETNNEHDLAQQYQELKQLIFAQS